MPISIEIWECNFCGFRHENIETVKRHEVDCPYDASLKRCYTCDNFLEHDNVYSDMIRCRIKEPFVYSGTIYCNDWVNLKLRIDKINTIKKRINEKSLEM
jgi:hypothetical protein